MFRVLPGAFAGPKVFREGGSARPLMSRGRGKEIGMAGKEARDGRSAPMYIAIERKDFGETKVRMGQDAGERDDR